MNITDTLFGRPVRKAAVAAVAATALAGGFYGTQAATAVSDSPQAVIRADEPKGDTNGGKVVAAPTPGTDARPAPAPVVERADEPRGDNGGTIVAAHTPGTDEQPAPAPAGD